jgi:hypothetical protein
MSNTTLEPIRFLDGILTQKEHAQLIEDIKEKRDFLTREQYEEIAKRDEQYFERISHIGQEPRPMTKRQYVQCLELQLFLATGVTRDY